MKRLPQYSQNLLRNPQLIKELYERTSLRHDATVIDIGAGTGTISSVLARYVRNVIAVEFEPRMFSKLRENMERYSNVTIYEGDFLKMELPKTPYSIFANIPFHLSSPIINRLIETDRPPESVYLIVQKQFGRKLIAESDPEHFTSQLGMIAGARYETKIRKNLDRTDFFPHPAVDTVFLQMIRRDTPLVKKERFEAYRTFTIECFSDPKKLAKLPLEAINAVPGMSPSRLHLDQWVKLFNAQNIY
ncbi:MAG: rRNA adenine dimethyltransferase family protein [Patescibacteria group bacterium]